ncbi:MAG: PepSY-associated TM helix domain-containing protein [Pseudomonas sp.]
MVRGKTRSLFQKIHLYIGLCFGGIFMLLGLTGSAIAWLHEIDSMLNPDLFHVGSMSGVVADNPVRVTSAKVREVVDRLAADPQYGRPVQLMLPEHADEVFVAWYRKESPDNASLLAIKISRQVMVNPYTLQVTGERDWGELGISRRLLMPTLFHLHRYLAAGEFGKTVIGVSGLVLFVTALSGVVLWWPQLNRKALRQALSISRRGSWPRFNYSFHRAAGFIAAPVFVVLGFSGWYFNLPKWVTPIVSSVATVTPSDKPTNQASSRGTPISPGQAMEAAQALYPNARVSRIALPSKPSMPYEIRVRQPGEIRKGDGATRIMVDAYSGEILQVRDPMRAPSGDTLLNWLFPLHSGEAFGSAGRIFISCFGVVPLLFLMTGLGIYLKRKKKTDSSLISPQSKC